jgi:hypothetical protein
MIVVPRVANVMIMILIVHPCVANVVNLLGWVLKVQEERMKKEVLP